MEKMERGSSGELAREALMRGMSYGQYVAARYYPVVIEQELTDGSIIRREAAVPPVLPDWEEGVARRRSRAVDGKCRNVGRKPKEEKAPRLCVVCGHPLRGGYRKYCSEECREEAKRARPKVPVVYTPVLREDKPCAVCGRIMRQATRSQKYCGHECNRIGIARRQREWREEHPVDKPRRICQLCGMELFGKQIKYCSACAGKAKLDQDKRRRERKEEA